MIITKSQPFTREEIEKLKAEFDFYIKNSYRYKKKFALSG